MDGKRALSQSSTAACVNVGQEVSEREEDSGTERPKSDLHVLYSAEEPEETREEEDPLGSETEKQERERTSSSEQVSDVAVTSGMDSPSPKKAKIDYQAPNKSSGADDSRGPDEARTDQQGPDGSLGSGEENMDHQSTSVDRIDDREWPDHRSPSVNPAPSGARTDRQDPGESPSGRYDARSESPCADKSPGSIEGSTDYRDPKENLGSGGTSADRERTDYEDLDETPGPSGAGTDRQGPTGIPGPSGAGTDRQGPTESSDPSGARINDRLTEERHFDSLYTKIIDTLKREKNVSDKKIWRALEDVRQSFLYEKGNTFSDVSYSRYENVCAYLFRDGVHGAGLARCRVLEAAENCEELRKLLCEKRHKLNVASLGGGPGNDALGFCSALVELGFPQGRLLEIFVVDKVQEWKPPIIHTNLLVKGEDFGNVSQLFRRGHIKQLKFIRMCLPLPGESLKNAHLIIAQRLLSSLPHLSFDTSYECESVLGTMKNIHSCTRKGALVLLINASLSEKDGRLVYGKDQHEYFGGFQLLYLSEEIEPYQVLESRWRFGFRNDFKSNAKVAVLRRLKLWLPPELLRFSS